jgi:protease PrsW
VGLGFAMVENVAYFARIYNAGGFAALTFLFLIRSVMFGLGHSLYTGATGAGLGLAEETNNPVVRRIAPFAGYFCAIFLHFLWNTTAGLTGGLQAPPLVQLFVILPSMVLFLALPGILTLLAITYFAWKRESKVIAEQLKDEVQRGYVRPGEYGVLTDDRQRARRVWQTLFRHGPLSWYLVRQFYNLESALAFRKWHTARGERLPSSLSAYSEDAYREHIAALRARLNGMGLSTE